MILIAIILNTKISIPPRQFFEVIYDSTDLQSLYTIQDSLMALASQLQSELESQLIIIQKRRLTIDNLLSQLNTTATV